MELKCYSTKRRRERRMFGTPTERENRVKWRVTVKSTKSQSFSQRPWWDQSEIMGFHHKKIIPKPFPHFLLRPHHTGRLLFIDWLLSQWGSSLASVCVAWPVLQEEVKDVIEKVTLNLILPLLSGPVWNSLGGFESGPGLNPCTLIYLGRVER